MRAPDSDGGPVNEVSLGNYTFTERGATFSSTGWVLYDTNAIGTTVSPGVDTQLWTQFNGAGSFVWGNGLSNSGNIINVDIAPTGGLTFSSTQLTLASYVAGSGLLLNSGVLNVISGNAAIVVNSDDVTFTLGTGNDSSLSVTGTGLVLNRTTLATNLQGAGLSDVAGVLNVNANNGLVINSDNVQVDPLLAGNGLTFSAGVIDINVSNGVKIVGDVVQVDFTNVASGLVGGTSSGLTASAGTLTVMVDGTSIIKNGLGQLSSVSNADVLAGSGLSASAGSVNIIASNSGILVNPDSIGLSMSVTTDSSLSLVTDGLNLNRTTLANSLKGNGLTSSTGVLNINLVKGVTFSNDGLFADASTILTTVGLTNSLVATNSTIQAALTAFDNKLSTIGAQEMVSYSNSVTGTFPKGINLPVNATGVFTFPSASDGVPTVFINGAYVRPNSATSSVAYFSTNGGTTGTQTVEVGSTLYLNPFYLDFKLDSTDIVTVDYLTRVS